MSAPRSLTPVRRATVLAGVVGVLVTGVGCGPAEAPTGRTKSPSEQPSSGLDTGRASDPGLQPPLTLAEPVAVAVPAHGITADLQPLALDGSGVLVPPDYGRAGWYAAGPEPGEPGAAVIAGHLDSSSGPDVFAALPEITPGNRILVQLEDGTTVRFRVTDVRRFAQRQFPTRLVYGSAGAPELRLITCGGAYDRRAGRYLDNVVVFATLA